MAILHRGMRRPCVCSEGGGGGADGLPEELSALQRMHIVKQIPNKYKGFAKFAARFGSKFVQTQQKNQRKKSIKFPPLSYKNG